MGCNKKRPFGVHTIFDVMGSPSCQAGLTNGKYVRAVPEPYTANRIVAAWWVLTGRAFAFIWPKSGDLEAALGFPEHKSLLRPATKAPALPSDPVELARVTRRNADSYRENLKPFA